MTYFQKTFASETILNRRKDIEWNKVEDIVVLIDERESEIIRFNTLGSRVWEDLDGKQSIDCVAAKLLNEFDVTEKKLKKEVSQFLKSLLKMELITHEKHKD